MTLTREAFLSNETNKQRFIDKLACALADSGVEVRHEDGDADCGIARTVLEKATVSPTTLVARDTDLLILLLHLTQQYHQPVYMAAGERNWDIKAVQDALNTQCANLCGNLLFCHALGGCDTTSVLFSIGKGTVLKKLTSSPYLREHAKVFTKQHNTSENVIEAGEKALVFLFTNGSEKCDLNMLRYIKYQQKTGNSNFFTGTPEVASNIFSSTVPFYEVILSSTGVDFTERRRECDGSSRVGLEYVGQYHVSSVHQQSPSSR